jgi:hypothetical protein
MSARQCKADGVQAVYVCNGNVVRVVSSIPGEGSTFYKPDGRVISCPAAVPSQIGGECMQLLMPNFCPAGSRCGNSTAAQQAFPGQNDSAEQIGNASPVENRTSGVETMPVLPKAPDKALAALAKNEIEVPAVTSNGKPDSVVGYLAYAILFLGIVSVGVLFLLFRKSLAEDDEGA